jgi:hypothetical protein
MYKVILPDRPQFDAGRLLPTRWGQVTLGQAARFAEIANLDTFNVLSVLLDLSPVEVMNLPVAFVNEQVLPTLGFIEEPQPDFGAQPVPANIFLPNNHSGVTLPVPKSLELATFGQATDMGALLMDDTIPVSQKRLTALAIMFSPAYLEQPYDSDEVAEFAEKVSSRVTLEEALPITDFFLRTTTASVVATPASSSASPSVPTSAPQDWRHWLKNGMRLLWSMRWPLAIRRSGPTSGASVGAKSTR